MAEKRTAAEFMAQLEADPEYRRRRAEKDAQLAASAEVLSADEAILVREARSLGFDIDSVWDFVNVDNRHEFLRPRFKGSYRGAYSLLVRHLNVKHHPRIREGIIRALTVRDADESTWQALLASFAAEQDASMRWVLANALRVAMPLRERRKHPEITNAYGSGGVA